MKAGPVPALKRQVNAIWNRCVCFLFNLAQDEDFRKTVEAIRASRTGKEAQREWPRKQLAVLDEEIVLLNLYYDQTCNGRSPIFALPNELLLAIFEHAYYATRFSLPDIQGTDCCDEERDYDAHSECQGCLSVEMDISQVCRLWRALALGRPDFWSTFNFRGRAWNFDPDLRPSMYLERSRERPLDIRLDVPADLHDEIPSMITMLLPHAARWRHFSLRYDASEKPTAFFKSMEPISAENLETFEISAYTEPSHEWSPSSPRTQESDIPSIFKDDAAPKLTSLRINSAMWQACLPVLSNLTVLQIDTPQDRFPDTMMLGTLLFILAIPTLTSLSLSQMDDLNLHSPAQPIVAPNLLHFRCFGTDIFFFIWQFFKAPLLELIAFKSMWIDGGWQSPEHPGDGSICEHFPSLRTISFINCYMDSNNTFTCIAQATPSVTQLMICNRIGECFENDPDAFFHMVEHGDTIYWPNLKKVSYSPALAPEFKLENRIGKFADMLVHRATELQTHCAYEIWNAKLNRLMDSGGPAGDLWGSIQKGEFHEIVTKDPNVDDPPEWCPWPARLNTPFRCSSEMPFSPYFRDELWL